MWEWESGEKQQLVDKFQEDLHGAVNTAVNHANDALLREMQINSAVAKEKAQVRGQERQLRRVVQGMRQLDRKRERLSSLRRLLQPRITRARSHLQKEENMFRKAERAARAWKKKSVQLQKEALEESKDNWASSEFVLSAKAIEDAALRQLRLPHYA